MVSKITEIFLNQPSEEQVFLLHLQVDDDTVEPNFESEEDLDSAITSFTVPRGGLYLLIIACVCCTEEEVRSKTHYVFINKELRVIVKSANVRSYRIIFGTHDNVWNYMQTHLAEFSGDDLAA
ncbi:hypothetical protein PPYR_09754 [Photinus pyralis]|uniref:Uncharacterized protein n=1 Tax=Photinus pyralis TaxID=7054 RepID=A0A5N4AED4_PHOPY|nr:hypothetical protein PPYR_09754 [Photinus pyralis]